MFDGQPVPWSTTDVADLETRLGVDLPPDYREYILTTGSGPIFERVVPGTDDNGVVREIYSRERIDGMRDAESGYFEWVPTRYLPVVAGSGGNLCVGLEGDVRGKVYWADFDLAEETIDEGESSESIMKPIAGSWTELIAAINDWQLV